MRNAKRDTIEPEIVKAMRAAGWLVAQADVPLPFDLICSRGAGIVLLEVKSKGGRLTESQEKAIADGWPIKVVWSMDDIRELIE